MLSPLISPDGFHHAAHGAWVHERSERYTSARHNQLRSSATQRGGDHCGDFLVINVLNGVEVGSEGCKEVKSSEGPVRGPPVPCLGGVRAKMAQTLHAASNQLQTVTPSQL